ncbi:lipopolysaccharide export system protein LptA [Polymorphobacter multimanifer]|uniref:Lipopolysaccharide export system protein LptA n=2 Tax=Polymorphobacter multimanifer TaxID=1070431 RepID=A0A841L0Q2_9SPHN|nr:LptA/OstA family protein [Polymorphobacter multimanifer]MBB6226257.1 lipopolysaccharide export system protein LptA [Polymorphobacter multimanifer]
MMRVLLPLLLLLTAMPAAAQAPARSALGGLDTSAPIDFDADRIEVRDTINQAVLQGSVEIRQGRMTLTSDQVTVLYTRAGDSPTMNRLEARGRVKLVSPSETVTSTTALYDVPARLVTMIGNVVLDRQGSVLNGQRLVLNLASGAISFDARSAGNTQGRVSGRFLVPERK